MDAASTGGAGSYATDSRGAARVERRLSSVEPELVRDGARRLDAFVRERLHAGLPTPP